MAPNGLNITFVIPPGTARRIRGRVDALIAAVILPEKLLIRKKDGVNLTLESDHGVVAPEAMIPKGNIPGRHRQYDI